MNKIRLQDLTPDVYYNQSRDFQFIGRLFDVVLNSVKTNTELLYNNPLSDNSDSRLIDLMTLTLGFKSKHNYNIKQLVALCSAFTYIIKNKGNMLAIDTALNTLLNAEGISDEARAEVSQDHKTLNLFIPQALTDTNLLKDLLVYILPAGMSCNIIREFQETVSATTELATDDNLDSRWTDVNTGGESELKNIIGIVPQVTDNEAIVNAEVKNTAGLTVTTDVYTPKTKTTKKGK